HRHRCDRARALLGLGHSRRPAAAGRASGGGAGAVPDVALHQNGPRLLPPCRAGARRPNQWSSGSIGPLISFGNEHWRNRPMNTANLQLEGLYLVIAAINDALISKGLLSREEIDDALKRAEQAAIGDERSMEELSPSNRDAVAFSARLLRIAN